ncbi:hypothetical protein BDW69DRAFT_17264 [Aspergillus filifer]
MFPILWALAGRYILYPKIRPKREAGVRAGGDTEQYMKSSAPRPRSFPPCLLQLSPSCFISPSLLLFHLFSSPLCVTIFGLLNFRASCRFLLLIWSCIPLISCILISSVFIFCLSSHFCHFFAGRHPSYLATRYLRRVILEQVGFCSRLSGIRRHFTDICL